MSIESLLNAMVIEPCLEEMTQRLGSPTLQTHNTAPSNSSQRRLPPLAPDYNRSAGPACTAGGMRMPSSPHRPHSLSSRQSSVGPSTPRGGQYGAVSRQSRPKYPKEEELFIWYMRIDLRLSWDKIETLFNAQFPASRERGGLQCKFYRVLKEWGVDKVRDQNLHSRDPEKDPQTGTYGVIKRTNMRFQWMKPEHQRMPCLKKFR